MFETRIARRLPGPLSVEEGRADGDWPKLKVGEKSAEKPAWPLLRPLGAAGQRFRQMRVAGSLANALELQLDCSNSQDHPIIKSPSCRMQGDACRTRHYLLANNFSFPLKKTSRLSHVNI